jgi:hypothetical protein
MSHKKINPAEPAFGREYDPGLSKLEYIAIAAMQGLLSNSIAGSHKVPKVLAKESVEYAKELIEALDGAK